MSFSPRFSISTRLANCLIHIERAKQSIEYLPITPSVLASLRQSARLYSTHYSTRIEGNRLTQVQVAQVIENNEHFPGRERDEKEVLGYYVALDKLEEITSSARVVTESHIQTLHALVMAEGRKKAKPTPYRDGQNVIRDSRSGGIVYMPPEAKDVSKLMKNLTDWLVTSKQADLPCPIRAGVAHYQFASIHPYYDGNGRTARLLTTLVLHLNGYGLKGLFSLEEYYAQDLGAYYEALTIGPSHNYYRGRATSDITKWIEYFCEGMAESFESVSARCTEAAAQGEPDRSSLLRELDPRQRKAMILFRKSNTITSQDVADLFSITQRAARNLLSSWVGDQFVVVNDPAKKSRTYRLATRFESIVG